MVCDGKDEGRETAELIEETRVCLSTKKRLISSLYRAYEEVEGKTAVGEPKTAPKDIFAFVLHPFVMLSHSMKTQRKKRYFASFFPYRQHPSYPVIFRECLSFTATYAADTLNPRYSVPLNSDAAVAGGAMDRTPGITASA